MGAKSIVIDLSKMSKWIELSNYTFLLTAYVLAHVINMRQLIFKRDVQNESMNERVKRYVSNDYDIL